jgi:hypothetical protein
MSTDIAVREPAAAPLDVNVEAFQAALDRRGANRKALMTWVSGALVDGTDYGSVKTKGGMSKPSLRKPGAEKICGMLAVTVHFPNLPEYEQAVLRGAEIKQIILHCQLRTADGTVVAEGVGARSLSQDQGDLNKALKMAAKSAHIDATLRMAGLSEVFTQDLEDMVPREGDAPATDRPAQEQPADGTPGNPYKCPRCGKHAVIKGAPQYGGGWVCWKKKEGCGTKWDDLAWEAAKAVATPGNMAVGDDYLEAEGKVEDAPDAAEAAGEFPDAKPTVADLVKRCTSAVLAAGEAIVEGERTMYGQQIREARDKGDTEALGLILDDIQRTAKHRASKAAPKQREIF